MTLIVQKEKICIGCGHPRKIFSKGKCATCARKGYAPIAKSKTPLPRYSAKRAEVLAENPRAFDKPKKAIRKVKQTDTDRAGLIAKLDALFSKCIRNKYAVNGMVKCFTCPKVLPIARIQNGHFISRANLATRWLENNCRPQCATCNGNHEVNTRPFEDALIGEAYGSVEYLTDLSRRTTRITNSELIDLIEKYKT
jgi:hypothetical protein